jgi:CTP synthase
MHNALMSITLIVHTSTQPALYGAMAAVAAHATSAVLMHRPAMFTLTQGADAVQHVAAEGALVASGLLWYERLTGRVVSAPTSAQGIVAAGRMENVVVPWHPPVQNVADLDELLALAKADGVVVRMWPVEALGDCWRLRAGDGEACPEGWWCRDAFGRLVPQEMLSGTFGVHDGLATPLCIALIGTEHAQRDVYPANLASLADAADAQGIHLKMHFVAPRDFTPTDLHGMDGVVLPGGSDMGNVPGQLAAAQYTLAAGIPTLGLCLGMQTMSTALVRSLPGAGDANLAEADPQALLKSFVPLAETPGLPAFRLGDQPVRSVDPYFSSLMGEKPVVRCNHRFGLNPVLLPLLREHGVCIAATDISGQIVDAISSSAHPFYWGMQGHPELSSRKDTPHPMMMDFLAATRRYASRAR